MPRPKRSDNGRARSSQKPTPVVALETITAADAKKMLAANEHNRGVREGLVAQLTDAILQGDWEVNGDLIRFDWDGRLIDGQHRLMAIVAAKKAVKSFVGRDFAPEVQETVDTGRARTISDILALRKEKNAALLGAAARKVWFYELIGVPATTSSRRSPSAQELLSVLDRHPGIRDIVDQVNARNAALKKATRIIDHSAVASMYYLMSLADPEDALAFWERIGDGIELTKEDPRYVLRERLLRENDEPGGGVVPKVKIVFAIRAWNTWRRGETLTRLLFKTGGARPDRFPRIEGCPILPRYELIGQRLVEINPTAGPQVHVVGQVEEAVDA